MTNKKPQPIIKLLKIGTEVYMLAIVVWCILIYVGALVIIGLWPIIWRLAAALIPFTILAAIILGVFA